MNILQYALIAIFLYSPLCNAAEQNQKKDEALPSNKMMIVKKSQTVGEEGLVVVTKEGKFIGNIYWLGTKGYDLVLKSKKYKIPICFSEITNDSERKRSWFFEDVRTDCNK